MATIISYLTGAQILNEINGTQEELDSLNSGYKYRAMLINPFTDGNFYCQGNDNDII